ncbi:hypothetical protein [Legionella sp. PC1000]|uniref:hypothetical protein n=1 Tax=Legionella sp. PC1000 TaxID=2746060 RepID=UPI002106CE49|nr:hypothetical protein [Legionella sp. PC1000]
MNLADLLPTSTIWTGQNEAPSPLFPPSSPALMHGVTSGNSPFRLNLHVRDWVIPSCLDQPVQVNQHI